jgi:hypothetical protein
MNDLTNAFTDTVTENMFLHIDNDALRAELAVAKDELASRRENFDIMSKRLIERERELDVLRAALEAVEWVHDRCPWCRKTVRHWKDTDGNIKCRGHSPDCQRQAALNLGGEK